MGAGDIDVQFVTTLTAAAIKIGVEAAVTATSATADLTITQLNDKVIVIVAIERA